VHLDVQWIDGGAVALDPEEEDDQLPAIPADDRDPVAPGDTPLGQKGAEADGPGVQLGEGEPPATAEVFEIDATATPDGVLGDDGIEVVVGNRLGQMGAPLNSSTTSA
jgi:hypothetical protein